jgi:hypothetical protein
MDGPDRRQFLLTKRTVQRLIAIELGQNRRDGRIGLYAFEVKMAPDTGFRIRINFPLTVLIQWFCHALKSIEKAIKSKRFFVSGLRLLEQPAQWHITQQREITGAH